MTSAVHTLNMPNCSTEFKERMGLSSSPQICVKDNAYKLDLQQNLTIYSLTLNMPNYSTEIEERLGLSSPAALRYAWRTTPTYSVTWILAQSNSFAVLCF